MNIKDAQKEKQIIILGTDDEYISKEDKTLISTEFIEQLLVLFEEARIRDNTFSNITYLIGRLHEKFFTEMKEQNLIDQNGYWKRSANYNLKK